jgi:hypothetical protein
MSTVGCGRFRCDGRRGPSRGRDRGSCANHGKRYLDRERQCQVQQRLLGHDNELGSNSTPDVAPGSYRCTAGANRYQSSTRDVTVISIRPTTANFNLDRS